MAITWKKLAYDEDLHTQNEDTALGAQSENLNMNTHKIVGVVDPTANQEVATKKYVDDNIGGGGNVSGPATHSANYVPQWNGTPNSKTLIEGFAITAAGKALLDDATVAAQRTTLNLDIIDFTNSTSLRVVPSSLELNYDGTVATTYIDFHAENTVYTDYALRIGRDAGANGEAHIFHRGTGDLNIRTREVADLTLSTTDTVRMAIKAGGDIDVKTNKIINVADPVSAQDAATKAYGDANWSSAGSVPAGAQGNMLYRGASGWLAGQLEFNPNMYTGTDTQKIQAAITAAETVKDGAYGGIVHIPTGVWTITSSLTIAKPITVYGDGRQSTLLRVTNGNFAIFNITATECPTIRDIKIEDSGTPTSGSVGVYVAHTAGDYNKRLILRDLLIVNMYDGIKLIDGYRFTIDNCHVAGFKQYGIYIANDEEPDGGDSVISGCIISQTSAAAATAALYQKNGGGLKFINNKLLGGSTGDNGCSFGIQMDFDYSDGSGVFLVTGNSIENFKTWHIHLNKSATGSFGGITIVSNEFASWTGSLGDGIGIACDGSDNLSDISIVGNTFNNSGVTIDDGKNIVIASNVFINGSNRTYAINNAGGTNVQASGNLFSGYSGIDTYFTGIFAPTCHAGDMYVYDDAGPVDLQLKAKTGNDALVSFYELNAHKAAIYWDSSASQLKLFTVGGTPVTISTTGQLTACDLVDSGTCDYVFEDDYNLMSLDNLTEHIEKNTRLPGIMTENGISVSELYEKTEEQALYILQLHQRLKVLEKKT